MAYEVVMPRLGWNMEKGSVGSWLKHEGDYVEAGETLFTVESDKATQEVEALESGTLCLAPDSPPPGREVPVAHCWPICSGPVKPRRTRRSLPGTWPIRHRSLRVTSPARWPWTAHPSPPARGTGRRSARAPVAWRSNWA